MRYLIDGYNLIFRLGLTKASLTKERNRLVQAISGKAKALDLDCLIVFDAGASPGESTHSFLDSLEIVFTAKGETADQWILEEIQRSYTPKEITLVTDDKQLAWYAKQHGVKLSSIEEFMTMLERRYKNLSKAKKQPPPSIPKPEPVPKKPSKGSLEYYENVFEQRYRELPAAKTKKITPSKKEPVGDETDEFDRWLRLFERKAEDIRP